MSEQVPGNGGTSPSINDHFVTTQADADMTNGFNLGGLGTGLLKQTVTGGAATPALAVAGTDFLAPGAIGGTVQAHSAVLDDLAAVPVTKGELPVGNGTHFAGLGIGTDGQVLTSDSTQADGMKWATPATISPAISSGVNGYRLTTESGVPVSGSDRTGQGTLYMTPYAHDQIALYVNNAWTLFGPGELSMSLAGLVSGKNYDIFATTPDGVNVTLTHSNAWTNDTTRADSIARQNGVLVAGSSLANAIDFNYGNQSNAHNNGLHLNLGTGGSSWSIEGWMRLNSTNQGMIFSDGFSSGNHGIGIELNNGDLWLYVGKWNGGGGAGQLHTGTCALNTWHHVAYTYDSGTNNLYCYLDNVQYGPINGTIVGNTVDPVTFALDHMDADVQQFAVYNTVLSPANIATRWNGGTGLRLVGTETGLTHLWRFSEANGANTFIDAVGAVSLTGTNGPTMVPGKIATFSTSRWLGIIRCSGNNITEDSAVKRFVWNAANQVRRMMRHATETALSTSSTSFVQMGTQQLEYLSDGQTQANLVLEVDNGGKQQNLAGNNDVEWHTGIGTQSNALANNIEQVYLDPQVANGAYSHRVTMTAYWSDACLLGYQQRRGIWKSPSGQASAAPAANMAGEVTC